MKNEWSAMSDKTRREILTMLKTRPHTAGEIADQFELSAATVSHHLSALKASGLVTSEKRAQTIIYSMNASGLKRMLRTVGSFLD